MTHSRTLIPIGEEELYQFFIVENRTRKETAEHFNCSEALIKKKCRKYGISKSSKDSHVNSKKALINKYGTSRIDVIGGESMRRTNLERYGTEKPFQSPIVQKKLFDNRAKGKLTDIEQIANDILIELGCNFEREYYVGERGYLVGSAFDFAILENDKVKMFIEVDGPTHFVDLYNCGDKPRKMASDRNKNQHCVDNRIPLLRLPHIYSREEMKESIVSHLENHCYV